MSRRKSNSCICVCICQGFVFLPCIRGTCYPRLNKAEFFTRHTWGQLQQHLLVTGRHCGTLRRGYLRIQWSNCESREPPQVVLSYSESAPRCSKVLLFSFPSPRLCLFPLFLSAVQVFFWAPSPGCCCGTYHPSLPMSLWSSPSPERS